MRWDLQEGSVPQVLAWAWRLEQRMVKVPVLSGSGLLVEQARRRQARVPELVVEPEKQV